MLNKADRKLPGYRTRAVAAIASFAAFVPFIRTKLDVVLFNAFPFNLLKGLLIGSFTMMVYKRLAPLLKGVD